MRRFSHYGYEPGVAIDWNAELSSGGEKVTVPVAQSVTDTESGIPYYLARPTDPGTVAMYQDAYGPPPSGGAQVFDFFKNLLGGVAGGLQAPRQVNYYRPPSAQQQSSMPSWLLPAAGVAAGVGVAYFLLRK